MPVKGLKDNAIKTSCEALNARLSDFVAMRLAVKQAHWNVKGPNFIGFHELLDGVAAALAAHEDVIAERVQILGGVARGTVEIVEKETEVKPYPVDLVADKDHAREISARLADIGGRLRDDIETVSEAGDEGTVDIFVGASRDIDKQMWFIESHLGR